MIYKRHTNVKEMLLADLNSKIMYGIYDKKQPQGSAAAKPKVK
jgi:hypothetical protein